MGSWTQIGYNAPGTKDNASSAHTNNFGYKDEVNTTATWTATAKTKLNDCDIGGKWVAVAEAENHSSEGTTYVKITTDGSDNTAACVGLTPSFGNLTRTTAQ